MEHRWGSRKVIDVPVRFIALPATIGTGRIVNVSMTGAFLETGMELRPMALLYVEMIHMPKDCGVRRRLSASVVRQNAMGVGIEWCESASKSPLYAELRAAVRDAARDAASEAAREAGLANKRGYRFEFLD
jgi:hypothetical protein